MSKEIENLKQENYILFILLILVIIIFTINIFIINDEKEAVIKCVSEGNDVKWCKNLIEE